MAFIGTKIQSLTQYLHISNWFMQFYPPFSSFFSTFGVKAANGINKMFKFSPHKVSFLKPREQECVNFFSKIFGVQIKKWQKKKYPAKENREQEYPLSLQNRTNRNGLLQIRRVIDWWLPYQGLKNEVDYYISTINKELSTDNGYKRKNCLAKSGKDTFSSSLLHIFRVCWN